ncbi:hydroxylamine reductase [Clostridium sp. KNHs216]|uniref:hydroxylamine reductase n=1 Tax=Clostridium sp. KNHs216 TaxID=1550235 RepID=UPI001154D04E|nr:hydroxylamine reductase [Clostridium sp. KNHs216]TQI66542.1 hydroxylamine reductase [Clostridium sp. KNHs216]
MFCFQCEQTAGGTGCTKMGVCGKSSVTADFQDELTGALVGLAKAAGNSGRTPKSDELILRGLFMCITNVNFDNKAIEALTAEIRKEKDSLTPGCAACSSKCGGTDDLDLEQLWNSDEDIRSLKSLLLLGMRGMAAYAYHAYVLGYTDDEVTGWFYKGLTAIDCEQDPSRLLELVMEFGQVNLKCMALLDQANTESFGNPVPTEVSNTIEKGPFIVVSGHDLYDLKQLLEQTKDKGINIYTHGEMLPAHGYPELKKYSHLKGNFGTAWQNQQKEFLNVPAPFLFTTNCLMRPMPSYADRVYTTAVVGYPEMPHIGEVNGKKDFSIVIEKALELGGYEQDVHMPGINGGEKLMTGFGHNTVLSVADQVIEAVKSGALRHIFLIGGCDGAKPGRNYFTKLVELTPPDSVVLTCACGKYRFNDLDMGTLGGLPHIMDMGQCNDAYSAIKVAVALSEAFGCGVNDLPLSIVLSWYEQKAVCILLTLLSLGITNIRLGPTLPAFVSPNVFKILVEKFNIMPITTPEQDLAAMLK